MVLNNIFLKILSIFLAVSMWVIVATSEYEQRQLSIPLNLKNVPENRVAVSSANLINVTLKGSRLMLNSLSYNDVNAEIDVSELERYKTDYRIKNSDIKVPSGVTVLNIQPLVITVTIDKIVEKEVDVNPSFIGESSRGFKIESLKIKPSRVEAVGAATKLKNIDFIETLPVNITDKSKKSTYTVGLKKNNGIKEVNPPQVEVTILFSEDVIKQTFEDIAIEVKNKNEKYNYKLLTKNADVTLKGRSDILENLNGKEQLDLFVNMKDIEPGRYLRDINFSSQKDVELLELNPAKARLEVSE